jgi:hypothetical protein
VASVVTYCCVVQAEMADIRSTLVSLHDEIDSVREWTVILKDKIRSLKSRKNKSLRVKVILTNALREAVTRLRALRVKEQLRFCKEQQRSCILW